MPWRMRALRISCSSSMLGPLDLEVSSQSVYDGMELEILLENKVWPPRPELEICRLLYRTRTSPTRVCWLHKGLLTRKS